VAGVVGICDNSIVHGIAATHHATGERAGVVDDAPDGDQDVVDDDDDPDSQMKVPDSIISSTR
jgi:hypothetical protein